MGGTLTTTQFYFYGKSHFTATGYQAHVLRYPQPDFLQTMSNTALSQNVYMVTGANNGIGKEITQFLYNKGATVYMVCRDENRALAAQRDIISKSSTPEPNPKKLPILVCDCGLESDVRATWSKFSSLESRLDGLICNAGALLSERTLTSEGVEVTLATHLLFGTYLLGKLAIPLLQQTKDSRMIMVSSGGMYNSKFPSWERAAAIKGKYDGQFAYVFAKRGQVSTVAMHLI